MDEGGWTDTWLSPAKAPDKAAILSIHQAYAAKGLVAADADVLLAKDTAITQYTGGSGSTIWVLGGTPVPSAAAWMKVADGARDAGPLHNLVEENHANGLLAATIYGGTVTVAWGRVVAPSEVETGPRVTPDFDKMDEWMAAINAAKTEKDFVEVVRANHAKGLFNASGLNVSEGGVAMRVTVVWVSFGLLGRSQLSN